MPTIVQHALAAGAAAIVLVGAPEGDAKPNSTTQSPAYVCPLRGSPRVRSADAVAHSGGRFDSSRDGGRKHAALDLNSTEGAAVLSARAGVVAVSADDWGPYGSTIIVDHGDGVYTVYAHLSDRMVQENDSVTAGQQIGAV